MSSLPDFESHGRRVQAFDDGHCPETFRYENGGGGDKAENDTAPRIVRYDRLQTPADVHIYDGVLDPNAAHMLYRVTASSGLCQEKSNEIKLEGESPWGTYVTIKEALEWIEWNKRDEQSKQCTEMRFEEHLVDWKQRMLRFYKRQRNGRQSAEEKKEDQMGNANGGDCNLQKQLEDMDNVRHALAVEAVAKFFVETVSSLPGTTEVAKPQSNETPSDALYDKAQLLKHAHGVAVWALSSNPGDSVQYHIDYYELLRYESNVTVPPLWAGTMQCSALWNDRGDSSSDGSGHEIKQSMQGGEFCVNLRGLEHYAENGYKGSISGDPLGGWRRPDSTVSSQNLKGGIQRDGESQWITIPYAFNRGIVHRGDLPHLSAPVESIGGRKDCGLSGLSRVIVGFNVFGHDVGDRAAKAPEHSKAFRRKVRLYRSTINASTQGIKGGETSCRGGLDISQIRKNKGLLRLLVLAKRERVKEELRRNQEQLSDRIWRRLSSHHGNGEPLLRVSDIVEEFGASNDGLDGAWPKSTDVHVHLHHMISTKSTESTNGTSPTGKMFRDSDGQAGLRGAFYCIKAVTDETSIEAGKSVTGELIHISTELDIADCKVAQES